MIESLALQYFKTFSEKNSKKLSQLFDENISLMDWEIEITGKQNVLDFNKKLFDNVDSIKVEIIDLVSNENIVMAELLITINGINKINVVDVLVFSNLKIKKIRAYKR